MRCLAQVIWRLTCAILGHSYDFPLLRYGTRFGLLGITKNISLHSFTPRHRLLIPRFSFSNWFLLWKVNYFLPQQPTSGQLLSYFLLYVDLPGINMTVYCPPWSPTASWLWCLGTTCTISYSVLSLKLSPIQNFNNSNTSVPYFPLRKYLSHRNSVSGTFQVNVGPSVLDNTSNIKVSIYRAPKSAQAREGLHFPLFWLKAGNGFSPGKMV